METIVAALISGAFVLVATLIGLSPKINKLIYGQGSLTKEHDGLSKEHSGLSKEIGTVAHAVRTMREAQIADITERKQCFSSLDDSQKQLLTSVENIGIFAEEFQRMVIELQVLQEELKHLKAENAQLHENLAEAKAINSMLLKRLPRSSPTPSREDGWDMER